MSVVKHLDTVEWVSQDNFFVIMVETLDVGGLVKFSVRHLFVTPVKNTIMLPFLTVQGTNTPSCSTPVNVDIPKLGVHRPVGVVEGVSGQTLFDELVHCRKKQLGHTRQPGCFIVVLPVLVLLKHFGAVWSFQAAESGLENGQVFLGSFKRTSLLRGCRMSENILDCLIASIAQDFH